MEMSVHSILKTSIFVTFLHYLLAREARATRLRFSAQMRGFSQECLESIWLVIQWLYGINVNYLLIIIIQNLLIISIKNDRNNKYTEKYRSSQTFLQHRCIKDNIWHLHSLSTDGFFKVARVNSSVRTFVQGPVERAKLVLERMFCMAPFDWMKFSRSSSFKRREVRWISCFFPYETKLIFIPLRWVVSAN